MLGLNQHPTPVKLVTLADFLIGKNTKQPSK